MPPKRQAVDKSKARAAAKKRARRVRDPPLTEPPTERLDIYVCGTGENGELGLGSTRLGDGSMPSQAPRFVLNTNLDADTVGIVQIAVGEMHCVALTHDNLIYTWGCNDDGQLARGTDESVSSASSGTGDPDDSGMNPQESTPDVVPEMSFDDDPTWTQVVATASACFALTDQGDVWGWGCFVGVDGPIGFHLYTRQEDYVGKIIPFRITELVDIVRLAAGHNHMLALDRRGDVWSWGEGSHWQLGRPIMENYRDDHLRPARQRGLRVRRTKFIAAGGYHSFAIDRDNNVFSWGLNNFGQCGIPDNAGGDNNVIERPRRVPGLDGEVIMDITGGTHHSIACNDDGDLLIWGRCDNDQPGILTVNIPAADLADNDTILLNPIALPNIDANHVAGGCDNSFSIANDGIAWSWGSGMGFKTGQNSEENVSVPTIVPGLEHTVMNFAGCGGSFSVLAGPKALGSSSGGSQNGSGP